jgi:hypothetical protein
MPRDQFWVAGGVDKWRIALKKGFSRDEWRCVQRHRRLNPRVVGEEVPGLARTSLYLAPPGGAAARGELGT